MTILAFAILLLLALPVAAQQVWRGDENARQFRQWSGRGWWHSRRRQQGPAVSCALGPRPPGAGAVAVAQTAWGARTGHLRGPG